nr:hypothetical transcript [Hymenolepis microstoma]
MSFVDIDTSLDFPDDNDSSKNISELLKRLEDLSKGVDPSKDPSLVDADESRVAEELAERCLSYLGDLCLGHYKLGVMDIGRAFRINIVFHFLRSLLLSQPYALSKDKLLNELSQNENRLKDLRLAALRFLQVIFLNTRYHLGLKKNPSQANLNDPLFTAVVSDMAFILRSESKRFGSQYIKEMLPTLTRPYNGVPDFCPDPTRTLGLAGTSTSLLPAIIMRIIAITILSNELLLGSDQDDKIREEQVKAIFEKSRQLPSLLLNTLDLLLIYSFRSLAKSTNIFTTSVVDMMRELYGEDDDGTCCGDEEISQKEGEAEARFFSKTIKKSTDNTESVGIESEEIEQEEESSDDGESEGSDFGRLAKLVVQSSSYTLRTKYFMAFGCIPDPPSSLCS